MKSFCPRVWEHQKESGNVRISELAVLSAFAKECRPNSNIFEIGTFDGRTTLNMAMSAPVSCHISTLDLPPDHPTKYELAKGERHMVEKPASGNRYKKYADSHPQAISRVSQLYGDSAAFDYTPYTGSCSLVFVDGSHAYEYAKSDTQVALAIAEAGGVVVWHDYGIWKGVTDALEEIESKEGLGLRNVRGTSLVVWRKPSAVV